MATVRGIYQSPGVYRNPTTGKLFQSTNGILNNPSIPKKQNPVVNNQAQNTVNTGGWNETLSNEAKKLRQIEAGGKLNSNQQNRLNELMGIKANKNVVANNLTTDTTTTDQTQPTTTETTPAPQASSTDFLKSLSETLFPGNRAIDSDRIGKDVLYNDALKRGEQVLDRRAAARGLLGSGAEIEAFNDFQSQLGAKTAERISQVDQQEAERLANIQIQEALRRERQQQNYFDNNFKLADLMASQDPSNAIMQALISSGEMTAEKAKTLANFLKGNYMTVTGGGSSGVGGTTFTPITPKGSADTSNTTPLSIAADAASNTGWTNTLTDLLGSIFK